MPEFNPLGKVPVLVLDDDTTLFDSRVIVEYLDNASPVGRLIPDDTRQRIQARRWEALADGCIDAAIAVVMEKRRPGELQNAEWIARQQGKVDRALRAMSAELGSAAGAAGTPITSRTSPWAARSAISIYACRSELAQAYPNLAQAFDKLAQRASFKARYRRITRH